MNTQQEPSWASGPSGLTIELAEITEAILLSDPREITGDVCVDFGDPERPRFLCSPKNADAFHSIAERYFDLIEIIVDDLEIRMQQASKMHRVTINLDLGTPSSHRLLAATGKLTRLLRSKEVEQDRITSFLTDT